MSVAESNGEETETSFSLLRLLRPAENCNVDRMSGTDLAYVGDVVYELFVRSRTVWVSLCSQGERWFCQQPEVCNGTD